jgi:hypothetical protein
MKLPLLLLLAIAPVLPASSAAQEGGTAQRQPRPDRWQLQLSGGEYLWDVRLVRMAGDSLVVSRSDSVVVVPLARIDEIRLMRATEMRVGGNAREALGALAGADDEVYDLTVADLEERRRIVKQILADHPPPSGRGRP